jgi:hypothetical protein
MLFQLKAHWRQFKRLEPGRRFETHYRQHRQSEAGKSPVRRVLYAVAGVVAFALGIVFAFIPGPAILFFLMAGALFAVQSLWVARALDWSELWLRAAAKAVRRRLSRHRAALQSHR